GVTVEISVQERDIAEFVALSRTISERKKFELAVPPKMMKRLLTSISSEVEAKLFLARYRGRIGAGACIIRCGRSLHYFWGATDREASEARVGEALQSAVIEWGMRQGCTHYDLEGIDPVGNPGTYAFKKKMGGREVALEGKRYDPLCLRGRVLSWIESC